MVIKQMIKVTKKKIQKKLSDNSKTINELNQKIKKNEQDYKNLKDAKDKQIELYFFSTSFHIISSTSTY